MRERGLSDDFLEDFDHLDRTRRRYLVEVETLKARRNKVSEEIAARKKQNLDIEPLVGEMRDLKAQIENVNVLVEDADEAVQKRLPLIPNMPHATVPVGKGSEDNQEIRRWGEPRKLDFEPRPHWEIGPALGILDFERAAKIAGAR